MGVNECPREDIGKYCSLAVSPLEERIMNVHGLIEKPKDDEIMSLYAILGRYVLNADIFDYIRNTPPNARTGEVFITDALDTMAKDGKLTAVDFIGDRYDMGNKLGIMQANCALALRHPEIGAQFAAYLKQLVKEI